MARNLSRWMRRFAISSSLACATICSLPSQTSFAQETDTKADSETTSEDSDEAEESEEEEKESDPYAVPVDADVDELFAFMEKMSRTTPTVRTRERMTKLAKQIFPAVIEAADVVLEKSDSDEHQIRAIKQKFGAYQVLVRYDPSAKKQLDELLIQCAADSRKEVAILGAAAELTNTAQALGGASLEEAEAIASETMGFLDKFGVTSESVAPVSRIASLLGRTPHKELALKLFKDLGQRMQGSEDAAIAKAAGRMMGSARRMELLGSSMELTGLTGDGQEFSMDDYKGKVVLVDFWASWCGPCMGELPNMKKNLEAYSDRGFAIVGINMDRNRAAFEKCVEAKDISWANIFSDEEGEQFWAAPMATHYGISGIPTAILIDANGKVVSLSARGSALDKQLEELLGPAESAEIEDAASSDASDDGTEEGESTGSGDKS